MKKVTVSFAIVGLLAASLALAAVPSNKQSNVLGRALFSLHYHH